MGTKRKARRVITKEDHNFILSHENMTVSELAKELGIKQSSLYYYLRKNNINAGKRKTSVDRFFENLREEK